MSIHNRSDATRFKLPDSLLYRGRRAWVLFLQGLFKSSPVGCFRWHENPLETEITISSDQPVEKDAQHKKPIIIVERTDTNEIRASRTKKQKQTDAMTVFSGLHSYSIVLSIIAREDVVAENIAWHINTIYPFFSPQILRAGQFQWIDNMTSISKPIRHNRIYPASVVPDWFMCRIVIAVTSQNNVSFTPENENFLQMMRNVTIQMNLD